MNTPFRILPLLALVLLLLPTVAQAQARQPEPARVFAAASMTDVLADVSALWQARGHARPVVALGASSALARQINAGAPADLFISADVGWMDEVAKAGRLQTGTRVNLVGNQLVLVAPKGRAPVVRMQRGFDFAAAFQGRLCTGEPGVVPVGIYAQQALQHLGWWTSMRGRIVGTDDVRAALNFVERGECALGIVYATDAAASDKVEVVATFPADSHAPIVYPLALLRGARPQGREFLRFLRTDPAARAAFERHGFRWLGR